LVPLAILIWFLLQSISPNRVGFIAIVSIVAVSVVRWLVRRFLLAHRQTVDRQGRPPIAVAAVLALRRLHRDGVRERAPATRCRSRSPARSPAWSWGIIGLTGLGLKFSAS
jgi:TRAP-type uncharacterized transport system fused permease subunit